MEHKCSRENKNKPEGIWKWFQNHSDTTLKLYYVRNCLGKVQISLWIQAHAAKKTLLWNKRIHNIYTGY